MRTAGFKRLLEELPKRAQSLAQGAYELFRTNSAHPSLGHHELKNTKKGRHRSGSCVVSVSFQYRALYIPDGNDNVWYWIGTHEDYNNFVGLK